LFGLAVRCSGELTQQILREVLQFDPSRIAEVRNSGALGGTGL